MLEGIRSVWRASIAPIREELRVRREYRDHMRTACQDVYEGETVNQVLSGVVEAYKAHESRNTEESLRVAQDAGARVGELFRPEVERAFRMHGVNGATIAAFGEQAYRKQGSAGLGYTREQDHALVLHGGDDRAYVHYAAKFKFFLMRELGFRSENVLDVCQLRNGNGNGMVDFVRVFRATSREVLRRAGPFGNVVVYHTGHGEPGSFKPGHETISYWGWARPFAEHQGNLVFVNDTCYADTAERPLTRLGVLPSAMVLSASGKGEIGSGNIFSEDVMRSYLDGSTYKPREIETVDQHLVPGVIGQISISGLVSGLLLELKAVKGETHTQRPTRRGRDLDYLLLKYPVKG